MLPWIGHEFGADRVEDLLEWCLELDVKTVTIYVFSTENFERTPKEIGKIMNLLEKKLIKILEDERIYKNEIKIKAIGRTNLLPSRLQEIIRHSEEKTKEYNGLYLNIAVAYGGRAEIIDATKKIAKDVNEGKLNINEIDEKAIEKRLYTSHLPKPDPDLIIRTSGEERLSGFLLWQSAYSELCFLDAFWPDIRRIDLWRVIRTYQQRKRRFGH
jgi:tritrans,polycis-undecaprenyl-diphosphate synthase [geranylgeranyl-diphosphate specific]